MAEITTTVERNRMFRDLSLSMGMNPVTNDVIAVTNEEAVKRSLKNLLMTQTGEVPFFPNFGSRVNFLLFEPIDPVTTALLEGEIRATIDAFEPRVRILGVDIQPTPDELRYDITLVVRLVNQLEPITLTLFLNRLR